MSWTIVESGMYMAAASIMRLRPLLGKFSTWFKGLRTTERADSLKFLRGQYQDESKSTPRVSKFPDNHGDVSLQSLEVPTDTTRYHHEVWPVGKIVVAIMSWNIHGGEEKCGVNFRKLTSFSITNAFPSAFRHFHRGYQLLQPLGTCL